MSEKLKINDILIIIERKNIKHMYLRVLPPNGDVKISAPLTISNKDINNFAQSKMDWIQKNQEQVKNQTKKRDLKYITGEKHYLWGKPYILQLIIKNKDFKNVFLHEGTIYLPIKQKSTFEQREKLMNNWYRNQLKLAIPDVMNKCVAIVGKKPNEWRIKNMKTRWGTCNITKKRIWLNLQLVKKSPQCLEYVITHELVHLYVSNHGKEFKEYMNKFYPNWSEVKKLVNTELV